ncbi:MAG TPA: DNA-deoxyinosine glycosylase [Paenibacillaceae bacterium]
MLVRSFDPVVDARTRVLILGTAPSQTSLEKRQYYANPRNQFWRIVYALFGKTPDADYAQRLAFLLDKGIGLWDVLESCWREGSSDAKIKNPVPNDFERFFDRHPAIERVYFNGSRAEEFFRRLVHGRTGLREGLAFNRLVSTSSAKAVPFEAKLAEWRSIVI